MTAIGVVTLLTLVGAFTALRGWRRRAARVDEDKRLLLEAPDEPRVLREQSRATSRHEA